MVVENGKYLTDDNDIIVIMNNWLLIAKIILGITEKPIKPVDAIKAMMASGKKNIIVTALMLPAIISPGLEIGVIK